jgi:hypothetical protein
MTHDPQQILVALAVLVIFGVVGFSWLEIKHERRFPYVTLASFLGLAGLGCFVVWLLFG